jgi:hypothetical protein
MAPPNDPKQSESGSSSGSGSGGGFFASIASSLSNFGTAMTRSVNGYPDPFLLLLLFFFFFLQFLIHVAHGFGFGYKRFIARCNYVLV